ncbi:MAG: hypothetical protein ACRENC_19885, partial [Gemmatimonadaceae bacterium]
MANDKKDVSVLRPVNAPAPPAPRPSVPDLPCDSGAWWRLTATSRLESDCDFTEMHARFLRARA